MVRKVVYWLVVAIFERVAICCYTIGYHHVAATENGVVAYGLRKYLAINFYVWLLALHKYVWIAATVKGDDICALCHVVDAHGVLLGYLLGLKSALRAQVLHYMTSHPLLRREYEPTTTHLVEYFGAATCSATCTEVYRWVVELRIIHGVLLCRTQRYDNFVNAQKIVYLHIN